MSQEAIPVASGKELRFALQRSWTCDGLIATGLLMALAAAPVLLTVVGSIFWIDVLNRVMLLAIAAVSLNLLLGNAGLYSFGHAVYLGIGGYSVGIAAYHGIENGIFQLFLAVVLSALFAFLTGLIALRTRGAHFIMITMAFSQMVYFVLIGLKQYGGDDGLTIEARSKFPLPLNFENKTILYYTTLMLLTAAMFGVARLRTSRFGLLLTAAKGSERRVRAVGFDPYYYRLVAFVIAGTICGVAGFLSANFTDFVTPEAISWTRSGELMFMVILGGVGSISGPLIGAAAFLLIEELLGSLTEYWQFWFGLLLIVVVLYAHGGILGVLRVRRPP